MGNELSVGIVRPVKLVLAHTDLPPDARPPTVGCFFDCSQGAGTGILVVSRDCVQNFSPLSGQLAHSRWVELRRAPQDEIVAACFSPDAAIPLTSETEGAEGGGLTSMVKLFGGSLGKGGGQVQKTRGCWLIGCLDNSVRVLHPVKLTQLLVVPFGRSSQTSGGIGGGVGGHTAQGGVQLLWGSNTSPLLQITKMSCPLNNACVVGYNDGTLMSYFLETRQLAGTYEVPLHVMPLFEGGEVTPISAIGFVKKKNIVLAGYAAPMGSLSFNQPQTSMSGERRVGEFNEEGSETLNSSTSSPPKNRCSQRGIPILAFSLERGKLVGEYWASAGLCGTGIMACAMSESHEWLVGVSSTHVLIWSAESQELVSETQISSVLKLDDKLGVCVDGAIDMAHSVVMVIFDVGCLGVIKINFNLLKKLEAASESASVNSQKVDVINLVEKDKLHDEAHPSPETLREVLRGCSSSEVCAMHKLYRTRETRVTVKETKLLLPHQAALKTMGYDNRTQTLLMGDGASRVKLAPDLLGHLAQRARELKRRRREELRQHHHPHSRQLDSSPIVGEQLVQRAPPGSYWDTGLPLGEYRDWDEDDEEDLEDLEEERKIRDNLNAAGLGGNLPTSPSTSSSLFDSLPTFSFRFPPTNVKTANEKMRSVMNQMLDRPTPIQQGDQSLSSLPKFSLSPPVEVINHTRRAQDPLTSLTGVPVSPSGKAMRPASGSRHQAAGLKYHSLPGQVVASSGGGGDARRASEEEVGEVSMTPEEVSHRSSRELSVEELNEEDATNRRSDVVKDEVVLGGESDAAREVKAIFTL
eukprot:GHVN01006493.1.p1 GENE.GHVN01006493.1~~GHVN01006493.1.p1  ORF type:complete len:808 (+),score=222.27 GHVN01006493.1:420-2843(+)